MKTIFHATVDAHELVLGFGDANIAPVETYAKIEPLVARLPEYGRMRSVLSSIAQRRVEAAQALKAAEAARRQGQAPTLARQNAEYQAKVAEAAELEIQLSPLVLAFEAAKSALVLEHAVYFHPGPGEDLIADADAERLRGLWEALGQSRQLKLDGAYVGDFRGREYWTKAGTWSRTVIVRVGDTPPAGAVAEDDLTEAQRQEIAGAAEAQRLAGMTREQRQTEAAAAKASALTQAAAMRSELEIEGAEDALTRSQEWYRGRVVAIADTYGVSV